MTKSRTAEIYAERRKAGWLEQKNWFNPEERAQLIAAAGKQPISAFVKEAVMALIKSRMKR